LGMHSALLIIDMQNDYIAGWTVGARERLTAAIASVIARARTQGIPIVWITTEFREDLSDAFLEMKNKNLRLVIEGTKGAGIVAELEPCPTDLRITKKRYSAFHATGLDDLIEDIGATRLIMVGINTHACIRMSAIDAYQRDLDVILIEEAVGSYDADHAQSSLDYMRDKIATIVTLVAIDTVLT
jgi:nicotinamidase-related amidase